MNYSQFPWKKDWKSTVTMLIGGALIGLGITDCIIAFDTINLDQIARGLTIFSAGLTILVVLDTSKAQNKSEHIQNDILLRLNQVEHQLTSMQQSQQMTEKQLEEIKKLLQKSET